MSCFPSTITTELMEHADGRPVAYIDATAFAIFTYQQPDGTFVIAIYTRDDSACGQFRLLVDGEPLLRACADPGTPRQACLVCEAATAARIGLPLTCR